MNAGHIPYDTWHHDMKINGGRIIAEGTPEEIMDMSVSHTGYFLKEYLKTLRQL